MRKPALWAAQYTVRPSGSKDSQHVKKTATKYV